MARTYRDAWGVPHVRATSVADLAHGQGEVTARDRAWQLEHLRRRATGTTAEVLGAPALPWDRLARRACLVDVARRAHAGLDDETRAFVAAYVAGVNAGLAATRGSVHELDRLGIEAQPWEEWTPLAVFLAQHLLFASLPGKLWAHRAREVLGDDARLLSHEGPSASGSNAWAVGGARTASGSPLVAGDPHRVIEAPGVYAQVRLACEDPDDPFDVVGFAFPGVPGVQHFAHAGDVAWAITNGMADYQDVYAERLRRTAGGVEALGPAGWEPVTTRTGTIAVRGAADEPVEVVVTPRGPVFEGSVPDAPGGEGTGLSVRFASDVLGDLGFGAFLPLLRARTVDDVDAALDRWVEPVNNVVAADTRGAVRYRLAGRVPVRAEANRRGIVDAADPSTTWTGWLEPLPRHDVPPDGQVVTANDRRGPESEPVGTSFAAPHRARRIAALLDGRDGLTPDDFAAIHDDALLLPALALREALVKDQEPSPAGAEVRDAVLAWDGRMTAGSAGAAAFAAWRAALVRRLAAEPVLAPLAEPRHDVVFLPWMDPVGRVGHALDTLVAAGTPFGLDLRRIARDALDDAAGHAATWGATHVVTPVHAFEVADDDLEPPPLPRVPVGGDSDCVRCTGSVPGWTDECYRGSVARYVWDLADRRASGWVVPLGAAGDPASPHHRDQLPLWAAGRLAPVVTDWDRLTEETRP
ncbi:penicillin acylase family protein [Nocardioides abyssi]|uniref:Penicillin acylase family protein n=1 Tax=Nocardioides abyssi TaxID=3058370 RepID=A0ABT8EQJ8_9ACTN|nr:penicillin acylase family protein [Nocardioides abyssi]MDN4160405.1 penicillin acylase family protein [Nocardioides abyssi]